MSKGLFSKTNIRIGLVQGFYWMASCVFVSYLVRLLHGLGFNDYSSGVVLTVSSLATLVAQPVLGRIADRAKSVKLLLLGCLASAELLVWLLMAFHSSLLVVCIIVFFAFSVFRTLIYIIDLWSLSVGEGDPSFSYGFTRSFGAVFYAVSAVFFGYAIDSFGYRVIIWCFSVLCLVLICVVAAIHSPERKAEKTESRRTSLASDLGSLFRNRDYMVLLVSYTLIEVSCVANQNYLTRKFQELGAGDIYTGISFLVMGLLQLLPLLMLERLKAKHTPYSLMLVCFVGLNLRNLVMGFARTPMGTVSCYLTEPFAFGLYIGVILYYMNHILPQKVKYLGTTLYSSVTQGLGGMIGNYLAGVWAERYGVLPMMKLIMVPAVLGLVVYLLFMLSGSWKKTLKN